MNCHNLIMFYCHMNKWRLIDILNHAFCCEASFENIKMLLGWEDYYMDERGYVIFDDRTSGELALVSLHLNREESL